MAALRDVTVVISSVVTPDVYLAKSYPDNDYDDNGRMELYKTPVYKVFVEGTDARGTPVKKEWTGLRFMPFWNDPRSPSSHYRTQGWVNSGLHFLSRKPAPAYIEGYEVQNTRSRFTGAIQIKGNFLVHAGPETVAHSGWGAAGCVEIIGSFDDFRMDIIRMSGSTETDIHKGMKALVAARKLFVQVDLAKPPDLRSALWGEVP
jgi:hypothetical protein